MSESGLNEVETVRGFFETFTHEHDAQRTLGLLSYPDYERAEFIEPMNGVREGAKIVERWRGR